MARACRIAVKAWNPVLAPRALIEIFVFCEPKRCVASCSQVYCRVGAALGRPCTVERHPAPVRSTSRALTGSAPHFLSRPPPFKTPARPALSSEVFIGSSIGKMRRLLGEPGGCEPGRQRRRLRAWRSSSPGCCRDRRKTRPRRLALPQRHERSSGAHLPSHPNVLIVCTRIIFSRWRERKAPARVVTISMRESHGCVRQ